ITHLQFFTIVNTFFQNNNGFLKTAHRKLKTSHKMLNLTLPLQDDSLPSNLLTFHKMELYTLLTVSDISNNAFFHNNCSLWWGMAYTALHMNSFCNTHL